MTAYTLIKMLVLRDFCFECGRHIDGLSGFYACFYKASEAERCDSCDGFKLLWDACGHGSTPYRAILMAAKIALKRPVTIPPREHFQ